MDLLQVNRAYKTQEIILKKRSDFLTTLFWIVIVTVVPSVVI